MKKFFFFRSSSNSGNNNGGSPQSQENQAHREAPMEESPSVYYGLRRSRSYSSADFLVDDASNCSSSPKRSEHSALAKRSQDGAFLLANALERPNFSEPNDDSSGSTCSSTSTKVLDRYIDEEHQPERNQSKRNSLNNSRLPPRAQYTAPSSPSESASNKSRSQSFRETKNGFFQYSSGDWVETEFGRHSPSRLAKNVIEKLSRTHPRPKSTSKEFGSNVPITIEDIYGGSVDRCYDVSVEDTKYYHNEDDEDLELHQKSKEAEETVLHLSQQIEQESFLRSNGFDVPYLIKMVSKLANDKMSLAIEV